MSQETIAEHAVEDSGYVIRVVRRPWTRGVDDPNAARGAYWSVEILKDGHGHSSQGARGEADARVMANGWYQHFYTLTHGGRPPFHYSGRVDVGTFEALEVARLDADKAGA